MAARPLAPRLPGPAADDRRGGRGAAARIACIEDGCPHVSEEGTGLVYERHFTRAEANALLPQLRAMLDQLRDAKDDLTDTEAHEALSEASPSNGGGDEGKQVGVAFLEVRRLLGMIEQAGIVLRDIDRGLIDFPAVLDDEEVYLCWELGEDEVAYWHDLETGYGGREPLD